MTPLGILLHDTAHDLSVISNSIWMYEDMKREGDLKEGDLEKFFERIKQAKKNLQNRLDKFYIENKDKYKDVKESAY